MNPENAPSYKELVALIKEMEDQKDTLVEFIKADLDQLHLPFEALERLLPYTLEDIESNDVTVEKAFNMLEEISFDDGYALITSVKRDMEAAHEEKNESLTALEAKRKRLKEIKGSANTYYQLEKEAESLRNDMNDILKDYMEYLNSPELEKKKEDRLQLLKKQAENEQDEYQKGKILKMISIMENSKSLAFLVERFSSYGKKEVNKIEDLFFHEARGSYIIDRYKKKIPKFGFDAKLYRYYFNLEERFLEEKYHPFNNLFLFCYMRFVAHADPYNKMDKIYVQAVTSAIANLIYHKNGDSESEKELLDIIRLVDDNFVDHAEKFIQDNTTHPTHPIRINAEKKYETERKEKLIAKMNEMKIEGYDPNATANELQEFFNDALEKLIAENEKATGEKVNVAEEKDGSVTITPKEKEPDVEKLSDETEDAIKVEPGPRTEEPMEPIIPRSSYPHTTTHIYDEGAPTFSTCMTVPYLYESDDTISDITLEDASKLIADGSVTVKKADDGREYIEVNGEPLYFKHS